MHSRTRPSRPTVESCRSGAGRAQYAVQAAAFRAAVALRRFLCSPTSSILGVAVLALLIYRQLRTRPVNASGLRVLAVLAVVGLVETSQFLQKNHSGAVTYAAIGGSLVLAAIFGTLRAATVRIWLRGGSALVQGQLADRLIVDRRPGRAPGL